MACVCPVAVMTRALTHTVFTLVYVKQLASYQVVQDGFMP